MALEVQRPMDERSSLEQAEQMLQLKYQREPEFHDLINKIVEKTLNDVEEGKEQEQFQKLIDKQFEFCHFKMPATLKPIPEETHKLRVKTKLNENSPKPFIYEDSESSNEVKISVDSFNNFLERSDFLLDVSSQVADFNDLQQKLLTKNDTKFIDEYDY